VISLTDCYRETDDGEPVVVLKFSMLNAFSGGKYVDAVLDSSLRARERVV